MKVLRMADQDLAEVTRSLVPPEEGSDHNQDRTPFRETFEAVGHAVRANYLYAGVADVFAESGDTTLFIQSELDHGNGNGLAAGRIAAGVCLAAAGMTRDELLYFRDDLMEDLRYSAAFVGRDQDRRILAEAWDSLTGFVAPALDLASRTELRRLSATLTAGTAWRGA